MTLRTGSLFLLSQGFINHDYHAKCLIDVWHMKGIMKILILLNHIATKNNMALSY